MNQQPNKFVKQNEFYIALYVICQHVLGFAGVKLVMTRNLLLQLHLYTDFGQSWKPEGGGERFPYSFFRMNDPKGSFRCMNLRQCTHTRHSDKPLGGEHVELSGMAGTRTQDHLIMDFHNQESKQIGKS
jgi:hypothetical protein